MPSFWASFSVRGLVGRTSKRAAAGSTICAGASARPVQDGPVSAKFNFGFGNQRPTHRPDRPCNFILDIHGLAIEHFEAAAHGICLPFVGLRHVDHRAGPLR